MRTIVGALSALHLLATAVLIACAPTPIVIVACLLISGCAATVCYGFLRDSFLGLMTAALFSATMVGLATAATLEVALSAWPALAWSAGAMLGLTVLNLTARAWQRGHVVLPIEVLVLRDKNTLAMSTVRGPGRVARLPFREVFARMPLLSQELLHQVERVDVVPRGGAIARQIDSVAVEATFILDAANPLRVFAAPSWQERVAKVLRQSPELRGFLEALRDHGVWQEVFSAVVTQQLELAVRRTAREMGLEPGELSNRRDDFAALLGRALRSELASYGIVLESVEVMRVEIAEVTADKQGRAYETLAAAELRARAQQLQLAIDHIRENGLPESPAMIETVMLLLGGIHAPLTLMRPHLGEADRPAAEEPLKERARAA